MLPDQITLGTNVFVKTSFDASGTKYAGVTNDGESLFLASTTTKRGQRRTLLRYNIEEGVLTPTGATQPVMAGFQVVLTSQPMSTSEGKAGCLTRGNALTAVEGLIASLERGEK